MAINNDKFVLDPIGTEYNFSTASELVDFLSGFDNQDPEVYCPYCKKERIFRRHQIDQLRHIIFSGGSDKLERGETYRYSYSCNCNQSDFELTVMVLDKNKIVKIGQYPDSVIFDKNVNNKLFSNLRGDYKTYYQNAIKSRRNNCHIGAFNYLRRIFEALVDETEKEYNITSKKEDNMKKRIKTLISKGAFEDFLIGDNLNSLYSLLSEGLHNLTEEACEKHYQVLHLAIETILEDRNSKKERERRKTEINKAIGKIDNEVFNRGN